ncbi:MAG TPA: SOS response-associated peptidase [Pyrinomonadaceae bacterium]|nr:SOS response-associated peptidase [Pyrinomonadaceae bacterium]
MCGRITLRRPERVKLERLNTSPLFETLPRYNIAPAQSLWTVTEANEERVLSLLKWGLISSWSKKPTGFINARAETLVTKPSFKESFLRRRCLIAADGFYEWEKIGKARQPHYFQMKNSEPFFFAGIWDEWQFEGTSIKSCAIITTTPNKLLATIHNRMPVILPNGNLDDWLRSNARASELKELLSPYPESEMQGFPVCQDVNGPQVDEPRLVEPIPPGELVRNAMLF